MPKIKKPELPHVAETVLWSTYMDDSMDVEAIKPYQDLSELWRSSGMYAKKWIAN